MLSEAKRLRELAKVHRELADVVSLGRKDRLALADEFDRCADELEGTGLDVSTEREVRHNKSRN